MIGGESVIRSGVSLVAWCWARLTSRLMLVKLWWLTAVGGLRRCHFSCSGWYSPCAGNCFFSATNSCNITSIISSSYYLCSGSCFFSPYSTTCCNITSPGAPTIPNATPTAPTLLDAGMTPPQKRLCARSRN